MKTNDEQMQPNTAKKRHKADTLWLGLARLSEYILLSLALTRWCNASAITTTKTTTISAPNREFIWLDSQSSDQANYDNVNSRQTSVQGVQFLRSKRRRPVSPSLAASDATALTTSRLFDQQQQSAPSQQQTDSGGEGIPAASPNFEAAFQGECNQNNNSNNNSSSKNISDAESATSTNPCEHICLDLHDGTYECSCFYGFSLAVDGYSCARLPAGAPQLPRPPDEPPLVSASLAKGARSQEESPLGAGAELHERHLGQPASGAATNRKLSAGDSGEILAGAAEQRRGSSSVAKARQELTSGAAVKVAGASLEQKPVPQQQPHERRSGANKEEEHNDDEAKTRDGRDYDSAGGARRRANAPIGRRWQDSTAEANRLEGAKYELEWAGRPTNASADFVELPDADEQQEEDDSDEQQDEADGPDADVRALMLANDRLAGELERALGNAPQTAGPAEHHERRRAARRLRQRLDYDLSVLGELVGETIEPKSTTATHGRQRQADLPDADDASPPPPPADRSSSRRRAPRGSRAEATRQEDNGRADTAYERAASWTYDAHDQDDEQ